MDWLTTVDLKMLLPPADGNATPGGIVAVQHRDQSPSFLCVGLADLEHNVPIIPETVFDTGSLAKGITAALLLLELKNLCLSLETSVREVVPELNPVMDAVRLRHLLNHTSGIRDYGQLLAVRGTRRYDFSSATDILSLLAQQKTLEAEPGRAFSYSNSGYFLLGIVVSRLAGSSLSDIARRRLFEPLKMTGSSFREDISFLVRHRAWSYSKRVDGSWRLEWTPTELVGDGGFLSTAPDLLRWCKSWHDGTWDSEIIRTLHTSGILNTGSRVNYGGGLFIRTLNDHPLVSHGGTFDGYRSELAHIIDPSVTIVALANWVGVDAAGIVEGLLRKVTLEVEGETTPISGSGMLTDVPGIDNERNFHAFRNPNTGIVWLLHSVNNSWELTSAVATLGLEMLKDGSYRAADSTLPVSLTLKDNSEDALLQVDGHRARLVCLNKNQPSETDLLMICGLYRSNEMEMEAVVTISNSGLEFKRGFAKDQLQWIGGDAFRSRSGATWVWFDRDAKGHVIGLRIDAPRAINIRFRRADLSNSVE